MVNLNSILFNTDSYKVSMYKQYPAGTEYVYSYIEARGGIYDETLVFGVQSFIKQYLQQRITREDVLLAEKIWSAHGEPFNLAGWMYIAENLGGLLPVQIKCVPEGSVVPTGNVLCTIENLDPQVPWLTTWIETALLRAIWYPTSVATVSFQIKRVIKRYLEESGDVSTLDFKLHDFGARGSSSNESASLGGAAHLVSFKGTDTMVGLLRAVNDYDADPLNTAWSIPAAEHSTITSWGRDNEKQAYANMVTQFGKPGSIFAVVSDSYNIFDACTMWSRGTLKDQVVNSGGTLVVRPDSGDPVLVLSSCVSILAEGYGFTLNSKGYKVLNNVRLIWGDGITQTTIEAIYATLVDKLGWSADNFAFGMGGALLNKIQRDDLGWAMKCSAICVNGQWRDVYKDPATAKNKASKRGRVTLYNDERGYQTGVEDWTTSALQTVYGWGTLRKQTTFEQVRERANQALEALTST